MLLHFIDMFVVVHPSIKLSKAEFDRRIALVGSALRRITEIPEKPDSLRNLISDEEIIYHHQNYLNLLEKINGDEKAFFNPHWIPISKGEYNFFVDLDKSYLPLIMPYFISDDLPGWYEVELHNSILKLSGFIFEGLSNSQWEQHIYRCMGFAFNENARRKRFVIFEGLSIPEKGELYTLWDYSRFPLTMMPGKRQIVIDGVYPNWVQELPENTRFKLYTSRGVNFPQWFGEFESRLDTSSKWLFVLQKTRDSKDGFYRYLLWNEHVKVFVHQYGSQLRITAQESGSIDYLVDFFNQHGVSIMPPNEKWFREPEELIEEEDIEEISIQDLYLEEDGIEEIH